ncbi:MAG TPA: trypsin-like peptidase domain-containing protein [Chthoniobacteraceae bacterium]|jgi:Do/DeqQ family serine protease|nr:trypsin-like peptidase domain-containing protein [Chthoniobacteraceae bacterium]
MPKYRAVVPVLCFALAALSHGQTPVPAASPASPSQLSPEAGHDLLHEIDDALASVFDKVAPAVVIIEADKKASGDDQDQSFDFYFHTPEGGEGEHNSHLPEPSVRSEGSGFIVRPDGYIYTNYHVIEDADKIDVKLRDHRHFYAHVVGADERTDIAVLKIDATNLPTLQFVDSDSVRVGQMCFAIGIPYNLDYSFCRGVVSAKGRGNLTSTAMKPMYEDYIQTDALINPGNSGGPLFDIDGRVMGMNTLINGINRGLAFAIPSNMLKDVGSQLIATGKAIHPWLGITVSTLDDEMQDSERFHGLDGGVCVETIEADAPAYKSDLRPNDVIIKVDGIPVLTTHDLQREVLRKKVGESVDLNVWRAGKTMDIDVVTDELPADMSKVAQNHTHAKSAIYEMYGLELAPPPPNSQGQPVQNRITGGVVVNGVIGDSPASRAGVHPGDLITAVEEKNVPDASSCLAALGMAGSAHPRVTISLLRDGQKTRAILQTAGISP